MHETPPRIRHARANWRYIGEIRPAFALSPGPGEESVWDYPRPPRVEPDSRHVQVICDDVVIADTRDAVRVLETASPPVFYFHPADVRTEYLVPSARTSFCEWKGTATYWSVQVGEALKRDAAWSYPEPRPGYEPIADFLSFYPAKLECWIEGHLVEAQPGDFYGGWVTAEIVGPFKGERGTEWW